MRFQRSGRLVKVFIRKDWLRPLAFVFSAHDRILKVARTPADLAGKQDITSNDIQEAIQFRSLERRLCE